MRKIILIILILLLSKVCPVQALGVEWTSGHHEVLEGDNYNEIRIFQDVTLDVLGGDIHTLTTYNHTVSDISGGDIFELCSHSDSIINIMGGSIYYTNAFCRSVINMSRGETLYLTPTDDTTIHLTGGTIAHGLWAKGSSVVHIYGYNFNYVEGVGGGQLTGLWSDGIPFDIHLNDSSGVVTYDHLVFHVIPEPAALLLLGLGGLFLRKKKWQKSRNNF